jgi:hypothetical protein
MPNSKFEPNFSSQFVIPPLMINKICDMKNNKCLEVSILFDI